VSQQGKVKSDAIRRRGERVAASERSHKLSSAFAMRRALSARASAGSARLPRTVTDAHSLQSASAGAHATLGTSEQKHLQKSLRLHDGDPVEVTDCDGRIAHGILRQAGSGGRKATASVELAENPRIAPSPPMRIVVAAAIGTLGNRSDFLIEKLTELGAHALVPISTERNPRSHAHSHSRSDRWHRVAQAASKQCLRSRALKVSETHDLNELLTGSRSELFTESTAAFFGDADGYPMRHCISDSLLGHQVVLFTGPEGGFTYEEQRVLREYHCAGVALSEQRLRVETAAVAIVSGSLALCGI